jgi:hypothetical protein
VRPRHRWDVNILFALRQTGSDNPDLIRWTGDRVRRHGNGESGLIKGGTFYD